MGSKNIPAPLNDELAKKMSMTTFEEVRELVNGSATARFTENNKKMLVESLANRLVQDNPINVPNWMTLSEAQYLAHQSKLEWDKMTDIDKEKYMELSEKNVKLSLILDKVREDEPEAQLSDQEVFDIIKRNLANTKVQTSLDDVIKEMQRTGYLQILFSRIKDEQAIDFILKNTNIVE
jgi:FKBP-type peptidyl-prolyl cis-trans isomerase (trigger factor)